MPEPNVPSRPGTAQSGSETDPSRPEDQTKPQRGSRGRRFWSKVLLACGVLIVGFVATELVCRFKLGLGDPPLSMSDALTSYRFRPSQDVHRFGNLVRYNSYSMRSDEFGRTKSSLNEYRIMVIGDSVINGGAQTDHSQLATTLVSRELGKAMNRPVVVGNISAGGWGPINEAGYVKEFGLFEADVVFLVLSSHDGDSEFQAYPVAGADPNFPDHRPICATWEAATRYLPRYLPWVSQGGNEGFLASPKMDPRIVAQCMDSIRQIADAAANAGSKMYIVLHWDKQELDFAAREKGWQPKQFEPIKRTASTLGVSVIDMYNSEAQAQAAIYRDHIHINVAGQRLFADELEKVAREEMLRGKAQTQSAR